MTGQSTFFGLEGGQENWLVAANTTGATGGKMISPQSIAIATAACDMEGRMERFSVRPSHTPCFISYWAD